jgi:hypothetical protein
MTLKYWHPKEQVPTQIAWFYELLKSISEAVFVAVAAEERRIIRAD